MAELFSLMPEFTSCKNDRVEATRSLFRSTLPASREGDIFGTGEISRDARSARPCARRDTVSQFALKMTPDRDPVSFRARARDADRVVLATISGRHREESRRRHSHTSSMRRATPSLSVPSVSVAADGPSAIGGNRLRPGQIVRKSRYQKSVRNGPNRRIRQHLQGVYFSSH
jgi:hypothetical protein